MSLARLRQSKDTDARLVLEKSFAFFTEGFDTPDLLDAKALLKQL